MPVRRRFAPARRRLASAAMAVGLVGGVATPAALLVTPVAAAHSVLLEVEPADGATVEASPEQVVLTFNEHVNESFASLAVTTEDDRTNRATGEPVVDGPTVSAEIEDLDPGLYTVGYRVTSADGHVVSGSSTFTVAGDGSGDDDEGAADAGSADGSPGGATSPAADATAGEGEAAGDEATAADEAGQDADDSGINPAIWVVGGLAVVLIGGAFLLLRRGN